MSNDVPNEDYVQIIKGIARLEVQVEEVHKDVKRINGSSKENSARIGALEEKVSGAETASTYHKWLIGLGIAFLGEFVLTMYILLNSNGGTV